jgi:hypothetical protein
VRENGWLKKKKKKNLFQNSDNFSKSSFSFFFLSGWETERKWSVRCWIVGKSQKAVKAQKSIVLPRLLFFPRFF